MIYADINIGLEKFLTRKRFRGRLNCGFDKVYIFLTSEVKV